MLCLNKKFGEHDVVKWCNPPMCPVQPWSEKSKEEFKCAMDNDDVDEAWRTWANAASVTVPYAEKQKLQAGWTCRASYCEVRGLWKRVRQFQSRGIAQADRLKTSSRCSVICFRCMQKNVCVSGKKSYDQRRSVKVDQSENGQEDSANLANSGQCAFSLLRMQQRTWRKIYP